MKLDSPSQQPDERTLAAILHDIAIGMQNVFTSEIHLARAELTQNAKILGRNTAIAIGWGIVALLGLLPFIAFLVIGLGEVLNHNYWLSSLLIGLVFMTLGGTFTYFFGRKLMRQNFTFPQTRKSLQSETATVKTNVQKITDRIQRRAS